MSRAGRARPRLPGLERLEAQVAHDLTYAHRSSRAWVPARSHSSGAPLLDVAVIGGGMNGLAIGFALLRQRVNNIGIFDRNPAGREGPWLSYARMRELRTPKELIGPDLGLPSLSFQSWYRATRGEAAWAEIQRAPNDAWMEYLDWFRATLDLPVHNDVEVEAVEPEAECFRLRLSGRDTARVVHARRVVLATGFRGAGGPFVPNAICEALPAGCYSHASDAIDFGRLAGKRVAVLGAGASAFDNAAVALESSAASVCMFARRTEIEHKNFKETAEFSVLLQNYRELDDAARWRLMLDFVGVSSPPPKASIERCRRHANFELRAGCAWDRVECVDGGVRATTRQGTFEFDHLIVATGFAVDVRRRRELQAFVDEIGLWQDFYEPPPHLAHAEFGACPYLGPAFEFREKRPGRAPFLPHIYDFGLGAVQSMGPICVGLSGMHYGVPRLVSGIVRSLFLEDFDLHEAAMRRHLAPPPG